MTSYEYFYLLEEYNFRDIYPVFLEEFKNYTDVARRKVLRDEPIRFRGSEEDRAFYVCMCEFLTNWYHMEQPYWFSKKEYVLKNVYKPFNDSDELENSPLEFKKRNIAIGKNDLVIA